MRHIFYIDPLEKLNLKKDSTLMLALTLQLRGLECLVLFEKDLAWSNSGTVLRAHRFIGTFRDDGAYLAGFSLTDSVALKLNPTDTLHMRLDPPFDGRYLRYLWLLDQWEHEGVRIINSPRSIMHFNEKLLAYQQPAAFPSWVGESVGAFEDFITQLRGTHQEVVLKPLDLYSGIGVEKWRIDDPGLLRRFEEKARELGGPIVAQPFIEAVTQGEVRAIYFAGQHLGSILKVPKAGEFISNIAHGGSFQAYELPDAVQEQCAKLCQYMDTQRVPWVAFDILGGVVTEANITCPGLLTEVSYAHHKNVAGMIADLL